MKNPNSSFLNVIETLRSGWFLIVFVGGLVYWGARQDNALADLEHLAVRITTLENRTNLLESGIGQLQLKIDGIKEDITIIKTAIIKT